MVTDNADMKFDHFCHMVLDGDVTLETSGTETMNSEYM